MIPLITKHYMSLLNILILKPAKLKSLVVVEWKHFWQPVEIQLQDDKKPGI